MANTLKDKVVIITGAGSGIGAATAALFEEQGAKVAALDIKLPTEAAGGNRIDIKCNVAVEEEVIAAVKEVVDKFGTIDVLCNVAGITDGMERLTEVSNEQLNRIMGVNFFGPFYLIKAVMPHFLSKPGEATGQGYETVLPKKGSIINVCSFAAIRGAVAGCAYTSSKHALLGLTRNTAFMYTRDGVRCNAVLPGAVATNIAANSGIKSFDTEGGLLTRPVHSLQQAICMPKDVAQAIVFLAAADAVNGAEVSVDHAWSAA